MRRSGPGTDLVHEIGDLKMETPLRFRSVIGDRQRARRLYRRSPLLPSPSKAADIANGGAEDDDVHGARGVVCAMRRFSLNSLATSDKTNPPSVPVWPLSRPPEVLTSMRSRLNRLRARSHRA